MPDEPEFMKIAFLISNLNQGGAERQLVLLASAFAKRGHQTLVFVLKGNGFYEAELKHAGVSVTSLEKIGRWNFLFLVRLVQKLRKERVNVLHSYLTVSNLVAILCKPFIINTRIVWGLRASNVDLSRYDKMSRLTGKAEKWLSPFADLIIANSKAGKKVAVSSGYPEDKIVVIPNAVDTNFFCLNRGERKRLREEWVITEDSLLLGIVARLDLMKGHNVFLRSARLVAEQFPHVRFVCVGDGPIGYKSELYHLAVELGIQHFIIWAGARSDMSSVYSALDIMVSSSLFGEGFSNSIAEAMACELPCVATDVGDSAWIVSECGEVVRPSDVQALAGAMSCVVQLSSEERKIIGEIARVRIINEFSIDSLVYKTEGVL